MLKKFRSQRSVHGTIVLLFVIAVASVMGFSNSGTASASAPSVLVYVHMDRWNFFPYEKAYAYGFSGIDRNGNYQCVPGCGATDYVDVAGGTREFMSAANGRDYYFRGNSNLMLEVYLGPNRNRYTYCYVNIPDANYGTHFELYYDFDRYGNLSCNPGFVH